MSKIFGTDGIRSRVNVEPMTPDTCLKIARSAGFILSKENKINRVVISKDTRLSGYVFEPVIASGFSSMGLEVLLVGPLPTPALAMLVGTLRADIGVMITASHNTFEDNGLKIFNKDGYKISNELENKIEEIVLDEKKYESIPNDILFTGRTKRLEDAVGRYTESIKNCFPKDKVLKGTKIVVDCANGANYKVAPEVLWELGCEVITIEDHPNGKNINLNCGAVNPKKLANKVLEQKADIGFAFDGDGDRLIVVDDKGEVVDGDKIIALLAKDFLNNNKLKNKFIVTTLMSNIGFENYINSIGLELIRTNVGDRNVINKMHEMNASIGGEQSGHIILSNYSKTGDGLLSTVQILNILTNSKKKSSEIFNLYESVPQIQKNIAVKNKKDSFYNNKKLQKFITDFNSKKNGCRLLIRPSGTEELIRILVEGENKDTIKSISEEAEKLIFS
tara:strand:- start:15617 stop:16960 length:1344 start_codon:yes stop_codon:yes gene_type:complete